MKRFIFLFLLIVLGSNSQLSMANTSDDHVEMGRIAYNSGNYSKAKKELEIAAKQGNPDAQDLLGLLYSGGKGVRQNYHEALKWFQLAANKGHAPSQGCLAYQYFHGRGVRQNYHEALKWFQLSANQGWAPSQVLLGDMYHDGQGVKQDKWIAKAWYGKACDNGCQRGCDGYRQLNEQGY